LARCQYRLLRHRDATADLARIVADCTAALGGNATGPLPPDQARTPRAGPGHEAAASKVRGPRGTRALALWAILGSFARVAVAVVAVFPSLGAGPHPPPPPTSPSTTGPTPTPHTGPPPPSSPPTEPPTSPQPTRTTPSPPQPTDSLPPETT